MDEWASHLSGVGLVDWSIRNLRSGVVTFDLAWSDAVHAQCDPVFAAANVGFESHQPVKPGPVAALLWEAEPAAFAARYPDSGIIESYGKEQWPGVHCIDFWLYVDADAEEFRFSVEGWNLPEIYLKAAVNLHGTHGASHRSSPGFRTCRSRWLSRWRSDPA